jgi:rhodanese-related sulfurtransferase
MRNMVEITTCRGRWPALLLIAAAIMLQACSAGAVTELGAREAAELLARHQGDPAFVIIDMRTPPEYREGHIPGARMIDYYDPQFKTLLGRLDRDKTYLVYCRSGNRTGRALSTMRELGFSHVYHLKGGILDWRTHNLSLVQPSTT